MQEVRIYNGIVHMFGTTLNVYAYIVDGMLIDSGPHRLQDGIVDFCLHYRPDKIVHTHFHEDHTGNTAYLINKIQVPAYIHPDSLDICRHKGDIPFYRLAFWGNRRGFKAEPLPDVIENEHSRFEVIHTPGHTTDHVVFLDREQGRLFSGDLFLHPKTRVVRRRENIPLLMKSLRKLLQEQFDTVYCAHGGEIKQGYRSLEQKLSHLEELQDQVRSLSQRGQDIKAIVKRIFPQTPTIAYFSLGEFSSYNLVRSLIEDNDTEGI
ncbi:MBL fold metallo-hydrolase [Desulfosporosinus sp.]|uniref:MBL fold metallo-hydrolase n=1 Tax=Desulfosporosinus sp. TaxID=157907 RepID=UPI0025C484FB|nr:MBL fold metallo-hydrolase [Desulfosporosinus sp.]MBC2725870.1 MBL fold metallo-hydrolase [Desulfosporosinus sp.]